MMNGVVKGYEKKLVIEGVGFKSALQGKDLIFNLGFSHSIKIEIPSDVKAVIEKNVITISGIDK